MGLSGLLRERKKEPETERGGGMEGGREWRDEDEYDQNTLYVHMKISKNE